MNEDDLVLYRFAFKMEAEAAARNYRRSTYVGLHSKIEQGDKEDSDVGVH